MPGPKIGGIGCSNTRISDTSREASDFGGIGYNIPSIGSDLGGNDPSNTGRGRRGRSNPYRGKMRGGRVRMENKDDPIIFADDEFRFSNSYDEEWMAPPLGNVK